MGNLVESLEASIIAASVLTPLPVLSSERAPYMKKEVHVRLKNM
jgi:hypothetical protein